MLHIPGGPAFSSFRSEKLLTRVREVVPDIEVMHAEFWHFVDLEQQLEDADRVTLERLLDDDIVSPAAPEAAHLVLVVPRLGTISPWAGIFGVKSNNDRVITLIIL